jgi:cytolysin (calcineurin-like family phosphatase)
MRFARCAFLATLVAAIAWGQFTDIESHNDLFGRCGAPGLHGCVQFPAATCTDPDANILRIDPFTSAVNCDLPQASGAAPQLRLYQNGGATPGDTFFTSTDLHFGSTTVSNADHVRQVRFMNQFANSGRHWPAGVGFPDEAIHAPAAIITTGDNVHDGQQDEVGAYRLLFEQSWISESNKLPVLLGLGNHDVGNDCYKNNCAQRMFDYVREQAVGGVGSIDDGSRNYSWDWNGVHFLQLNKWAGDTQLGSGANGTTHDAGLAWLVNDLANNVGNSGRPVVIFQHFGLDPFSTGEPPNTNDPWWTAGQRLQFWNLIRTYNVIGMFTGHIHSTGIYDFTEDDGLPSRHIDDFVGGTGGQDPCLNNDHPACGGRGQFFAVRITDQYLDVASLEWRSNADGTDRDTEAQFTNLAPPFWDTYKDSTQGPAFINGQMGCRKIINRQLIDVSNLVNGLGAFTRPSGAPITITNTSQATIPGPLALEFITPDNDITNKSFVDRCSTGGNVYMYPDGNNSGDLAPGASVTFTPVTGAPGYFTTTLALVRVAKARGADPARVDLTGTQSNLPADGTITIYGPPNQAFTATSSIESSTQNWISISSPSSKFDQLGMAVFHYVLNRPVLAADRLNATEAALLKVTSGNPIVETDVWVTLHLRTADSFTLTSSWFPEVPLGQTIDLKVVASYVPVIVDDGSSLITGTVTLNEINGQSSTVLATGYLNNNSDTNPQPDNTVLFTGLTLSPGIHTLQASYAGDSFYAANVSPLITLSAGRPTLKLITNPPNLLVSIDGTGYKGPSVLGLPYLSTHTLNVFTPQNAPGARFVFSGWSDLGLTRTRTITVDQSSLEYTANFDAEYQLTTAVNDPAAGTISVTPSSGDGYYPASSLVSLTAKSNPGFVFKAFDLAPVGNPVTLTMNGPVTITAYFERQSQAAISWANPADIFYGTPLSSLQLNATATVPGTFVYTPTIGAILPAGSGQILNVVFTPSDARYAAATASVRLNVKPVAAAALAIHTILTRDTGRGQIELTVLLTNTGSSVVDGVQLTTAHIATTIGTPIPQLVGAIPPGGSVTAVVTFPASLGASGAPTTLAIGGVYSGGTFSRASRIVLP